MSQERNPDAFIYVKYSAREIWGPSQAALCGAGFNGSLVLKHHGVHSDASSQQSPSLSRSARSNPSPSSAGGAGRPRAHCRSPRHMQPCQNAWAFESAVRRPRAQTPHPAALPARCAVPRVRPFPGSTGASCWRPAAWNSETLSPVQLFARCAKRTLQGQNPSQASTVMSCWRPVA